jgi:hypothetical protein
MHTRCLPFFRKMMAVLLLMSAAGWAGAWELQGSKTITAHTRDKQHTRIGVVHFEPQPDGTVTFKVSMDHAVFTDYFLSMKEFKCLSSPIEVTCHVPYPYQQPGKVTPQDLTWLEHNLLFLFKMPSEFGAKLWNGLYYRLKLTDTGLVGTPMAIDLNHISAPPDDLSVPSFGPDLRDAIPAGARWLESITIE